MSEDPQAYVLFSQEIETGRTHIHKYWTTYYEFDDIVSFVKDIVETYKLDLVIVEAMNSEMWLVQALRRYYEEEEPDYVIDIIKYKPKGSKSQRVSQCARRIRNGRVQFNPDLEDSQMIDEIVRIGTADHDDVCDATTQAIIYSMKNVM